MKKIYSLTFLFILFAFYSNSQSTYYKMLKEDTTTWQHWGAYASPGPLGKSLLYDSPTYNSIAAIDTITIVGKLYKKLYHLSLPAYLNYSNKQLIGYLREDTINKKVYLMPYSLSGEVLLFDFSLNVNDSIFLNFANAFLTGYYRVDSILVKNVLAGNRKHFYLRKHINNNYPNTQYLEYIEGIGSTYHLMYLNGAFTYGIFFTTPQCYQPWTNGLSCKHDDNVKQFQSCTYSVSSTWTWPNNYGSCNYYAFIGGLKINNLEELIKIGPNPTNDKIEVSIEHSFETINCSVTDMAGKIIMTLPKELMTLGKNSFSFSTKDLAPGIYILQVKLNETLVKRPIVVQH